MLDLKDQVRDILRDVLSLGNRADRLDSSSALLGALPELDSMAVVSVIAALEDRFDISIPLNDVPTTRTVEQVVAQVASLVAARSNA